MTAEGQEVNPWIKVLLGVALAALIAGLTVVPSTPAEALCFDTGSAYTVHWGIHGTESYQDSATCDGDNWYAGRYKDSSTPNGSCMWIMYVDDNVYKTTSQNCDSTYRNYSYLDVDSRTPTWICDGYGCSSSFDNQGF